jgi:hypothetical protein
MDLKIVITGSSLESSMTRSLYRSFLKLGCKVKLFDESGLYGKSSFLTRNRYANRILWKHFSSSLNNLLIKTIHSYKPDLLLVLKGIFIKPRTLKKIKDTSGTILFNFNPDNPFNTCSRGSSNGWIIKSIPIYDVYLTWGKLLLDQIRMAGAKRVEYLPFASDTEYHYPVDLIAKDKEEYCTDVAFVGNWEQERENWLSKLEDFNMTIWGTDYWKTRCKNKFLQKCWQGRPAYGEEMAKVCMSSKINLNILRVQNKGAHNMRTFEIPACGGFMLHERSDEVLELFEEGKDVACFSTPQELKEKINYYLNHEEERMQMAEAGHKKTAIRYTYLCRAKRILELYEEVR